MVFRPHTSKGDLDGYVCCKLRQTIEDYEQLANFSSHVQNTLEEGYMACDCSTNKYAKEDLKSEKEQQQSGMYDKGQE